jgi:hypothetical protein
MRRLLQTTPGIVSFVPSGPGIAVETGFRHPIELRACPLFDPAGLVLLRGRGDEPWVIDRLAPMGELTALARVALRPSEVISPAGRSMPVTEPVSVPLRLAPSSRPLRNVTATWVATEHLPLLRRLAYALPHVTIAATEIALTPRGAALRCALGIDAIPLGTFYVELYPRLYVPAGYDVAPDVAPDVLARALGVSGGQHVFIGVDGRAVALDHSAFVPLEAALLDAPAWEPLEAHALAHPWTDEPIELTVGSIGLMPLRGVQTARGPQDPQER